MLNVTRSAMPLSQVHALRPYVPLMHFVVIHNGITYALVRLPLIRTAFIVLLPPVA